MRNICLSKLHHLLFVLLLFALTGCGASNSNIAGTGGTAGNGNVTAKLQWGAGTEAGKTTAKAVAAVPAGVVKIRLTVSGANVPVVRNDISIVSGSSVQGQISGIYPGSISLVIQALDANDTALYEGFALNVVVAAGKTTDVGIITMTVPTVKAADTPCLGCHETTIDLNGQNLVADFKQSGHYTNVGFVDANGKQAGCAGCHGPSHNNPDPSANGVAGRCFECHTSGVAAHTTYVTNGTACSVCHVLENHNSNYIQPERMAWVNSGHGDLNGAPWVPSASHAWRATGSTANFLTGVPSSDCLRCHTADGFAQFVSSGYTNVNNLPGDSTVNPPLICSACHTDNTFKVRPAAAFTARYNAGNSPKTFPDVANSNLCIDCHSARESGDTIFLSTSDFSNKSFVNSHYMGAAATMYMSNAFINYTGLNSPAATNNELNADGTMATFASTKPYAKNNLPDNASVPGYGIVGGTTSAHRRIGTPLITGTETYLTYSSASGGTKNPGSKIAISTNGPCVSCHMQADNAIAGDTTQNANIPVPTLRPGGGHSLKIDQATAQQICLPCHADAPHLDGGDGFGNPKYTVVADLATLESAQLEPQSECFQNGLNLLKQILLVKYMIKYDNTAYPYFYDLQKDPTGKTAITDWTRKNVAGVTDAAVAAFGSATTLTPIPVGGFGQVQAKRLMGACFNLNLLVRDPGAYVHARTFTQRLIYDALDFLDNNKMDFSTLTSARKLNPAIYHGTNINVRASDGTLATESMTYLTGTHFTDPGAIAGVGTLLKPMKLHP